MGSILGTLLAFVIVFGILVFVHEFGHFFMAKLVKIRVEVFSWGYGKRLIGFKKGETDYRISMIPLGGYVKFSGEEVLDQKRELLPYDFMAKKRWERFLVMVMGSIMNIILAVLLMAVINMVGVSVPEYNEQAPVIGWIEEGSPAEHAGLQIDDEILSINDQKTNSWSDVYIAVGTKPDREIDVEFRRREEIIQLELLTESKTMYEMGYAGFMPKIFTEIKMVTANSPAEKAGLQPGDVIVAIDGGPAYYFQFIEIIMGSPEKELDFLIDRDGEKLTLKVTPKREGNAGKIGVMHGAKSVIKKYGFFSAFIQSAKVNADLASKLVGFIKDLISGEGSAKQLGGPIEIANFSYAALRAGFLAMASLIAFISLQLGIVNLVPIPLLDGGQIFVLILEGIFRRDFSPKVKQIVMQIGFVIIISLFVFLILNDIVKRLPNGWDSLIPW